jgi:DNA-binding CsgD family transcriptional regulator
MDESTDLTPREQEVLRRRRAGESYEQVAEACACTPDAVRRTEDRARRKLRDRAREKASPPLPVGRPAMVRRVERDAQVAGWLRGLRGARS